MNMMNIELSLRILETYLTKEQNIEISYLLINGPDSWQRSYLPVPEKADLTAEVLITCQDGLAWICLVPKTTKKSGGRNGAGGVQ
jgi:hypothetical protein